MKKGLGFCEDGSEYSGKGVRIVGNSLDLKRGPGYQV